MRCGKNTGSTLFVLLQLIGYVDMATEIGLLRQRWNHINSTYGMANVELSVANCLKTLKFTTSNLVLIDAKMPCNRPISYKT